MRTVWPTRTRSPTVIVSACASAPMIGRTRKSPALVLRLVLVDHDARASARTPRAPARGRRARPSASRKRSSAGREASSAITFPSAAVIVISGPTGAAPCETQGSIVAPASEQPTAPAARRTRRRETATPSRPPTALARPPSTGMPGSQLPEPLQQRLGREAVRVGEHDHRVAPVAQRLGQPCTRSPRRSARPRSDGSRSRRPASTAPRRPPPGPPRSRGPAHHSAGAAADQDARGASRSWTADRIHLPCPRWGAPANITHRSHSALEAVGRLRGGLREGLHGVDAL